MANGAIIYGSTTYNFDKNWVWGYAVKEIQEKIRNRSTSGKITQKKRYSHKEYELEFKGISDAQLASLEAAEAYDGNVTFCPTGAGGVSITGFWELGTPQKKYLNNNDVTARFTESK